MKKNTRIFQWLYRLSIGLWLILWPVTIGLFLTTVITQLIRLLLVTTLVGLWLGALVLFWRNKFIRVVCIIITLIIFSFVILPERKIGSSKLRQEYINSLVKYEGTPYVYGGESRSGIDCSGLVRCGLINAYLKEGLLSLNPKWIREGISLWWRDSAANDFASVYSDRIRVIIDENLIGNLDYGLVKPGDMAIMSEGSHILVYLGEHSWIEADPTKMLVKRFVITEDNRSSFTTPVKVIRWKQLEDSL